MSRIYRSLLYLYPVRYRREFGDEMALVFQQARQAHPAFSARTFFWIHEVGGLLCGAAREGLLAPFLFTDPNLSRRSNMRRFPRSTIVLMIIIFAGVVLAIQDAKLVVAKYEPSAFSVWSGMPEFFTYGFVAIFVLAAAVWAVLFALHRTGMHRLSDVQTWEEQK